MFSSPRSSVLASALRRRGVLIASGTAVLVAVGGGTTAAFAAGTAGTPTPSASSATCQPHLRAILRGGMPKELKADLRTLHGEKKGDRAAERKAIREKALTGAYGDRVERVAHLVAGKAGKGHTWAASLPAALKADLKTLHGMTAKSDARKAEAQKIAQKAIAGDYGTAIQTRAKAVQQRVDKRCAAAKG